MAKGSGADPGVGVALRGSTHFRSPAHLLLPGRCPEPATFDQVIPLGQLAASHGATQDRAAVVINSVAEVLAGHADAGPFPVAEVVGVHEVPVIHHHSCVSTSVLLAIVGVGKRLLLGCHAEGRCWNFPGRWAASSLGRSALDAECAWCCVEGCSMDWRDQI